MLIPKYRYWHRLFYLQEDTMAEQGFKKIAPEKKPPRPMELTTEDRLPHLRLNQKQLPEIKNWKVGETYTIAVKMKKKSSRIEENEISACFAITGIKNISDNYLSRINKKIREK